MASKKRGRTMKARKQSYSNQMVLINNSKNGLIFNTVNGMDGCGIDKILGAKRSGV